MNINLNRTLEQKDFRSFRNFIKNVEIIYNAPACFGVRPKVYKVADVSEQPSFRLMFTYENKKISVQQYFELRGYKLKYPNLNCVAVGANKSYLPLELCTIRSQVMKVSI